ncbi:MAG: hypothetical protein OEW97_01005 [Gammaproteobacteria bacterium]|nr:hypothetical protein [Gammaproteobacteria bacterium]
MAVSRHSIIAPEGWKMILIVSLIVAALNYFLGQYFIVLWAIPVIMLWLFRDPHRSLPSEPLGLLSPVNGTIIYAEAHPDPFLGRDAFLFRISMSMFDIFSIRSVTEGKIIQQWLDPEDDDDERSLAHAIQIKTDEDDDVVVVLRPGRFFKKLSCDAVIGQRIGQGHRCGAIPFGSVADIYVPADSVTQVKVGDFVEAGLSVLAVLKHHH